MSYKKIILAIITVFLVVCAFSQTGNFTTVNARDELFVRDSSLLEIIRANGGGSSTGALIASNNLSDLDNTSTARTNLGITNGATNNGIATYNSSTNQLDIESGLDFSGQTLSTTGNFTIKPNGGTLSINGNLTPFSTGTLGTSGDSWSSIYGDNFNAIGSDSQLTQITQDAEITLDAGSGTDHSTIFFKTDNDTGVNPVTKFHFYDGTPTTPVTAREMVSFQNGSTSVVEIDDTYKLSTNTLYSLTSGTNLQLSGRGGADVEIISDLMVNKIFSRTGNIEIHKTVGGGTFKIFDSGGVAQVTMNSVDNWDFNNNSVSVGSGFLRSDNLTSGTGDTDITISGQGSGDVIVDDDLDVTGTITGGTIENTAIGATTPSTGAFTTGSFTGDVRTSTIFESYVDMTGLNRVFDIIDDNNDGIDWSIRSSATIFEIRDFANGVTPYQYNNSTQMSSIVGSLEVNTTTGALIVPRMTTTQRNALTAVNGMIIYNTTTTAFNFYENGSWVTK